MTIKELKAVYNGRAAITVFAYDKNGECNGSFAYALGDRGIITLSEIKPDNYVMEGIITWMFIHDNILYITVKCINI